MFQKPQQEVVLFSPMEGVITLNGKTVNAARVELFLKYEDNDGEKESFTTDSIGKFFIPAKKDVVKLSTISKFVVAQEIRVHVKDTEYLIWTMGKGDVSEYGELSGKPVNLRCELTDAMVRVEVEDGLLGTSCKWDLINKKGE